jgi:hypothetical protein
MTSEACNKPENNGVWAKGRVAYGFSQAIDNGGMYRTLIQRGISNNGV